MNDLILTRDKNTGKLAKYPRSHLAIFPNLECAEEDEMCTECVFVPEVQEVTLKEPATRKKTSK